MVAIDNECHEDYHRQGASDKLVSEWKSLIETYLKSIGTWNSYVD